MKPCNTYTTSDGGWTYGLCITDHGYECMIVSVALETWNYRGLVQFGLAYRGSW